MVFLEQEADEFGKTRLAKARQCFMEKNGEFGQNFISKLIGPNPKLWPKFYETKVRPKLYLKFWPESYSSKVCLDSLNIVFRFKFATLFFLLSMNSNLSRPILLENIQRRFHSTSISQSRQTLEIQENNDMFIRLKKKEKRFG